MRQINSARSFYAGKVMIELPEVIQNLRLHDTFDEAALKAKGSLVMRLNASSPRGCMVNKFRRYQLIIKIFWS